MTKFTEKVARPPSADARVRNLSLWKFFLRPLYEYGAVGSIGIESGLRPINVVLISARSFGLDLIVQ